MQYNTHLLTTIISRLNIAVHINLWGTITYGRFLIDQMTEGNSEVSARCYSSADYNHAYLKHDIMHSLQTGVPVWRGGAEEGHRQCAAAGPSLSLPPQEMCLPPVLLLCGHCPHHCLV